MKVKYSDFLEKDFNKDLVQKNIEDLKDWLYKPYGLNLSNIILMIFDEENYLEKLSFNEIDKFYKGIDLLREKGYPNIDNTLLKKFPKGIENVKIVKENGKWHQVNKLNTNYSDLSDLLTDLIEMMYYDSREDIRQGVKWYYDKIINGEAKKALLVLRPKLYNIINYYFVENGNGIEDFKKYTINSTRNSIMGENAEKIIIDYLSKKGFEISYYGGDGDFIDMRFGIDLIVYRNDFGYITIQVKSYLPNKDKVQYYNVDWIAYTKDGIHILDKKTFDPIIL